MKNIFLVIFCGTLLSLFPSCKKESFTSSPDARLRISTDSLKFDTIFTSTGSVTQSFKIVNENEQQLRLSNVQLMGGAASAFKININGVASTQLNNVEIAANDSIYIFVSVTVNPSAANLPFIISDSISIQYNGNQRWVNLQAFGQNANFLRDQVITTNTIWTTDLPYVILGSLLVAPHVTLTLNPGVKIYSHADAPFVVDGTLLANGTVNNKVIFTGDRLDEPYRNFPASWPGIFFRATSKDNFLQFVEIKNAYQGLVVLDPASNANPKLTIQQSIIDNAYNAGIFGSNSSVQASNLLVSNCANNIYLEKGGNYSFTHCTVASYSSNLLLHKTPVLSVANFASVAGSTVTRDLQAIFTNSIFWGDNGFVENEIVVNKEGSTLFDVRFSNCLYRASVDPANATIVAPIKNIDPLFDSVDVSSRTYNFRHNNTGLAPGTNKGIATTIAVDLDNNPRPVGLPDLGCYEKQ